MSQRPWTHQELAVAGLAALRRARARAEEIARATRTQLVVAENGRVVLVDPGTRPEPHPPTASVAEQITDYVLRPRPRTP